MRTFVRVPAGPILSITVLALTSPAALTLPAALAAQSQPYVPGQVIVLAEPGVISVMAGLRSATHEPPQVAVAKLRDVFSRRAIKGARTMHPSWSGRWEMPDGMKIRERRKGDVLQPDELTDLSHYYVLEFPDTTDVATVIAELSNTPGIVSAEPNYFITLQGTGEAKGESSFGEMPPPVPNDPIFGNQYGLRYLLNPAADIGALDGWAIQSGLNTVKIAFLDTGIERTHSDFGSGAKVVGEYDFVHDDPNAAPDLDIGKPYHGTAVAGIAAAETNDGFGIAGVCGGFGTSPGCSILAAKILGNLSISQGITEWLGTTDLAASAIAWAVANGAKVINNSYCRTADGLFNISSFAMHDAMRNAHQQSLLVAAMGNVDGACSQDTPNEQVAPAAFADIVMSVGASNKSGNRVASSQTAGRWESATGPHISVMAPGLDIWTDDLNNHADLRFDGTSGAAPFVAGLAGLVFSNAQAKGWQLLPHDVRQIIQLTASDRDAVGHDNNTGHGLIDAAKALQVMQAPNRLAFATAGPSISTCHAQTSIQSWVFWADHAVYSARRCEIRWVATFANRYKTPPLVWGRPLTNGGITASNPNSQIFSTSVVPGTVTTTGATFRTYVYERWSLSGQYLGWYPAARNTIQFAYAVLGELTPFVVTAGAPGVVTVKATYPLNGSASHPASGWDWDRSDNGGSTWAQWATTQNSSFVAFAGNYTINWRLFARRTLDAATALGFATTAVCTTGSCPQQLQAAPPALTASRTAPLPAQARPPGIVQVSAAGSASALVSGDHFGAGPWISRDDVPDSTVAQFYSLAEGRDLTVEEGTQTNSFSLRPGEKRRRTTTKVADAFSLEETRAVAGTDASIITLTFDGLTQGGSHRVSFALDPDLGSQAGGDQLAWLDSAGTAVVTDRGGRAVAYAWLLPPPGAISSVREYTNTAGWGDPVDPAEAFREQRAPSRVTNQVGDVRFILSVGPLKASASGRLVSTLISASSVTVAVALANLEDARRKAAAGPAGTGATAAAAAAPRGFGLRQSLRRQGAQTLAGGTIAASSLSPRAQLRMFGITALDYTVADGESMEVSIKIFSSAGQLVRNLVREYRAAGEYHVNWDGLNERGQRVAPGVYVAVMEAGSFKARRKLVVTH